MNTKVIIDLDEFSRATYYFYWFKERGMVLQQFLLETRQTKKHKHRKQAFWDRLSHRDNRMARPEIPATVIQAALEQLREQIQYCEDPNA